MCLNLILAEIRILKWETNLYYQYRLYFAVDFIYKSHLTVSKLVEIFKFKFSDFRLSKQTRYYRKI